MLYQRIKELRILSGKTQQEISNLLSITRSAYALYETNKRQLGYDALLVLANYYNVSLDYLFDRSPMMQLPQTYFVDEDEIIKKYRELDDRGQENIRNIVNMEYNRIMRIRKNG